MRVGTLKPQLFDALSDNPDYVSTRGNKHLSRDAKDLRGPGDYGRGVFAETNLSASQIGDNMKRLLDTFGIPHSAFAVYLRADRDAA